MVLQYPPALAQTEIPILPPDTTETNLEPVDQELILLPTSEGLTNPESNSSSDAANPDSADTSQIPALPNSELPDTETPDTEIPDTEFRPLPPPTVPIPAAPVTPVVEAAPSPFEPVFEPLPQPPGYQTPTYNPAPANEFNQYRLGIGDLMTVLVVGFPEFTTQGGINLEGQFQIPILGLRDFRGMTLPEVEAQVSEELGQRYLQVPPEVIVTVNGPRTATVAVTGEVLEPGFYELPPGSNPFDAMFRAGNSRPQADLREILVRRTLKDGSVIEQSVDLLTPLQTGAPMPPMFLLDGDAIVVSRLTPENQATYDRQLAASSNLAQATITVRVLNHPGDRLGSLSLPNGSTFIDALTQIGPSTTQSDLSDIALVRFDPEQGRAITQKLNGRRALFGDSTENIPLEDQDVIVIGRSLIAKVSNSLNVFTQPFRDVLGFLLFFREIGNSAESIFGP